MPKKREKTIDIKTVRYIAHLARIELEPKELEILSGQLKKIIEFIDQLKKLAVEDVPPTSHILPLKNVYREDILSGSLPQDKVLKCAPQKKDNFFVVPKIIE
jgi:aspartyl-tRNA(Asn)/glutamyl-tRNA(Gln) amidotransferase subunit C